MTKTKPKTPAELIQLLDLQPHPEGGYYAETFRDQDHLVEGGRAASTLIYYLMEQHNFSHIHRLDAAEVSSMVYPYFDIAKSIRAGTSTPDKPSTSSSSTRTDQKLQDSGPTLPTESDPSMLSNLICGSGVNLRKEVLGLCSDAP